MAGAIPVGMSEIKLSKLGTDTLSAMGLGSCIGVCMYDPSAKTAGMAHVMLPESKTGNAGKEALPGKFADTAIPALLDQLVKLGANKARIKVAIAGGAEVFSFGSASPILAIGKRNTEAVKAALQKVGLKVAAEDTGGSTGRTVVLDVGTGRVNVRIVGGQARELTSLG